MTPAEREDAVLAQRAARGEERAFAELMRRHKGPLYRFVRAYVGDASEAYDILQETFVAAWTGLPKYDPARRFDAWVKRIALNKCRDWSRRRKVREFFYTAKDIDTPGLQVQAPEDAVEQTVGLVDRLEAAIAALPASLKEPLLMTVFDGLTHRDAGEALGLSAKAVEVRVYRAKQKLAAILQ